MKKKGRVKIWNSTIAQALGFPDDWEIEKIQPFINEWGHIKSDYSEMLISGNDFPETNNRGDAEDCELIFHQERIWVEVKKLIRKEKEG